MGTLWGWNKKEEGRSDLQGQTLARFNDPASAHDLRYNLISLCSGHTSDFLNPGILLIPLETWWKGTMAGVNVTYLRLESPGDKYCAEKVAEGIYLPLVPHRS